MGGGWPRPGGVGTRRMVAGGLTGLPIAATACAFQTRTASFGSAAATELAGISPATAIRASAVTLAIHRLAPDR